MIHHYYPPDIAQELKNRWPGSDSPLPSLSQLAHIISVAYQASLLKEEGRPVECHIVYFSPNGNFTGEKSDYEPLILKYSKPRAFNEQEIRRLSPTARRGTNMMAVYHITPDDLSIWGMLVLCLNRNQRVDYTNFPETALVQTLFLHVRGPGTITFYCGALQVLTLQNGHIEGHGFLEFPTAWVDGHFQETHMQGREYPLNFKVQEDEMIAIKQIASELTLYFLRRSIFHVRNEGHGGLLVIISENVETEIIGINNPLEPKYGVYKNKNGGLNEIIRAIINRLKEIDTLSWEGYLRSNDIDLRKLKVKLNRFADLLADLMAVDGALVLNKSLNILGFGTEIQVPHLETFSIYKALDVEGNSLQSLPFNHGGTRHRAAYRLCLNHPACLAIVISQDGTIQFVRNRKGKIVFWNQLEL